MNKINKHNIIFQINVMIHFVIIVNNDGTDSKETYKVIFVCNSLNLSNPNFPMDFGSTRHTLWLSTTCLENTPCCITPQRKELFLSRPLSWNLYRVWGGQVSQNTQLVILGLLQILIGMAIFNNNLFNMKFYYFFQFK